MFDKFTLNVSEKDKKILYVLASLGIFIISYFLIYIPLVEKSEIINDDIIKLERRFDDMNKKYKDRSNYIASAQTYKKEAAVILDGYKTGFSQPDSIMFVNELENSNDIWLRQVGLTDTVPLYSFGKITSSNPQLSGKKVYNTNMIGYKTNITLTYEVSYENLKEFLKFLNTYESKCSIENITMNYNANSSTVNGNMTISEYTITGENREYLPKAIKSKKLGTDNIFFSDLSPSGIDLDETNGAFVKQNYDIYLALDSIYTDEDSVVVGLRNDSANKARLSVNDNKFSELTIRVSGTPNAYKVSYKIGNITYPQKDYILGEDFQPGEGIEIYVMSTKRVTDKDDYTGVNVTIINETDIKTTVLVENDDENSPRFVTTAAEGDIDIFSE